MSVGCGFSQLYNGQMFFLISNKETTETKHFVSTVK